jgi:hypothetical protein
MAMKTHTVQTLYLAHKQWNIGCDSLLGSPQTSQGQSLDLLMSKAAIVFNELIS